VNKTRPQNRAAAAERNILHAAREALKRTTGIELRIRATTARGARRADATLEFLIDGHKHRFRPEVKTADRFAMPALIKAHADKSREPVLLVAPFISRQIAERCRELHLPFIDTAGNAYLERPGLLIYVSGQTKPADNQTDDFRALNPAGLQIVFVLASQPALLQTTYRTIGARAGVALGSVGPVMKDLESRGYVRFGKRPDRRLLDPERMIQEWATHYPVALRPKLNPRRFQADPERLRQLDLVRYNAYWGGEPAAEKLTHYLKPAQFTIYVREPVVKLAAAARMRADAAGNLEILDAFWNLERDRDLPDVVPPVLAYADLVATNDGRNAEAARIIHDQRIAPALGITR
jgi:hypothetical protein